MLTTPEEDPYSSEAGYDSLDMFTSPMFLARKARTSKSRTTLVFGFSSTCDLFSSFEFSMFSCAGSGGLMEITDSLLIETSKTD
jgi:hypothetical protein